MCIFSNFSTIYKSKMPKVSITRLKVCPLLYLEAASQLSSIRAELKRSPVNRKITTIHLSNTDFLGI